MPNLRLIAPLACAVGCLAWSVSAPAVEPACTPAPYCVPGAPHVKLKIVKTTLAKLDLGGRLRVRVTVDEAAKVTLSGKARTPAGKTVSLGKRVSLRIARSGTRTATLKLSSSARTALFTVPRATVTITAKALDALGNRTTKKSSLTFR